MKSTNFLLGAAVGILAAYVWRQIYSKSGKNPVDLTPREIGVITQEVIQEEGNKFGDALKNKYDIVMPSDQISKKVREKARKLTDGRFAIKEDKIKEPVNL
jgi:hypothetical protein